MIGYLKGQILEHSDGKMLVALPSGSDGAVGYSVQVPHAPSYLSLLPGKTVELFVYTHVREDALDLFGFASRAEKDLFLILLSVNGIGPKVALGILSNVDSGDLIGAIQEGNITRLTKVPGVGKKTAERMVLELTDTLKKKIEAGMFKDFVVKRPGAGAISARTAAPSGASMFSGAFRDAHDALVSLGYRDADVSATLNRLALEQFADRQSIQSEEVIRVALQQVRTAR